MAEWTITIVVSLTLAAVLSRLWIFGPYRRAQRNLDRLLDENPEREQLAEAILQDPTIANIRQGREMVYQALQRMNDRDRREINSGFYQESDRGRAWYTARLITKGRSNRMEQSIPSDRGLL